ncbi:MAG: AbrB/MazE/SpoVT family DNA-binding domain-containing protein, partial [Gammaproteobacteria bacterium]
MLKVKVTQVGNSMGILLPKEALSKLKAEKGDTLYLVEGPEGLTLTPYNQDFEQQMKVAE